MSQQSGRQVGTVAQVVDPRPMVIEGRAEEVEETQEDVATETPVVVVKQETHIHNAAQPQEKVMTTQPSTAPAVATVQLTPEQIQALMAKAQSLSVGAQQKLLAMTPAEVTKFSETLEKGKPFYQTTAFAVGVTTLAVAATGVGIYQYRQARQAKLESQNLSAWEAAR